MIAKLRSRVGLLFLAALLAAAALLQAQTRVKPGFNLFSVQQDVEVGQQSAREIEKQLPILNDRQVQDYVSRIGDRLARYAPGADYPYQFKVVNNSDINAFALPGGFMYVNRGLIAAARTEGELAGVMGHEIGHVALRHGTNQASKAYLTQSGLGIVGALLGGTSRTTASIIQNVGGFGLNAVFLKFSRTAENQADIVGVQMLAKAGYDPMDMASMFEMLAERSGRNPGAVETFFSSHPPPQNRMQRIQREVGLLGRVRERPPTGDFRSIQARLNRMPKAPSMRDLAEGRAPSGGGSPGGGGGDADRGSVRVEDIERPSSQLATFRQRDRYYRIRYPQNWQAQESDSGFGVTLAPPGGVGGGHVIYGMMLDRYRPASGQRSLHRASDQLMGQMLQGNDYLRPQESWQETRLDGRDALTRIYTGRSPVTEERERVEVYTRFLQGGDLLYLLFIAPTAQLPEAEDAFGRMRRSLVILE